MFLLSTALRALSVSRYDKCIMKKRVLVIQSRENPAMVEIEQNGYRRVAGDGADVHFLSALDPKLSWETPDAILKGFDAVIFGGSGEFDLHGGRLGNDPARLMATIILSRLRALITEVFASEMPALGICFGHQLIAQMRGGCVMNDSGQKKAGSYEVNLTSEGKCDPLFESMPHSFVAQYGHRDSVTELPDGAVVLASGPSCRFSALRYGNSAYTFQFHPEVEPYEFAGRLKTAGYLPEGVAPESVIRDSPEASRLIRLFVEKIASAN